MLTGADVNFMQSVNPSNEHVRGESLFIDDWPKINGELVVGVVTSPVACGDIQTLNLDKVLKIPEVHSVYTYKDFTNNFWGPIIKDTPLLAEKQIHYFGEPIALIAAVNKEALTKALQRVQLVITETPGIHSIKTAIEKDSFFNPPLYQEAKIITGDVKKAFKNSEYSLRGEFFSGGQEHFYFETQSTLAVPEEGGNLTLYSSSQHPSEVQHVCANALGLKFHQVVCEVKRMGGAFGGKETQASHIAALAALVACKTGRPARLILSREDDIAITGKRHPFYCRYKAGFNDEGKLNTLETELYADGGCYLDLSPAILQRALLHIDNAYYIPNVQFTGKIAKTNTAPNTAFRGFGAPQAMAVIENIMEEIALKLNKDAAFVRAQNLYGIKDNNITPYGQKVDNNQLHKIFNQLINQSRYQERAKEIKQYNLSSKSHVKGIALTACKFGVSFTSRFLNQGNALVNVHLDGTIQVSTGATDMGQGVNIKIQTLVAQSFGLSINDVRLMTTSTEKNHNTSATAASSGSDINASAALLACDKIKTRLSRLAMLLFKEKKKENSKNKASLDDLELQSGFLDKKCDLLTFQDNEVISPTGDRIEFKELLKIAYLNRVGLGDYAYYKTPQIAFDKVSGTGTPFLYYTQGMAVSEVLIDRFTGYVKVLRADILMDLGRSINENIDYGQISGGFVQGMGWVTTEALYYEQGRLLSRSPSTYKIPAITDLPKIFNIELIENKENKVNVAGSKAVGEPPFPLALSVWCAIKHGLSFLLDGDIPDLKLPATNEEILFCQPKKTHYKKEQEDETV